MVMHSINRYRHKDTAVVGKADNGRRVNQRSSYRLVAAGERRRVDASYDFVEKLVCVGHVSPVS